MKSRKDIWGTTTRKQSVEFGMVCVLVSIAFGLYWKIYRWFDISLMLSLVVLICPVVFKPFAAFWWSLSKLLSWLSSRLLLSVIFFVVVTPVGVLRRIMGKDTLRLRQFKKSTESVLIKRDHLYTKEDMVDTF